MTVLFISSRPMPRCENITAVYNAYDGDKIFDRMHDRTSYILSNSHFDYDLVVTDELVRESKAPVIMIYHGAALGKTYLLQRPPNYEYDWILRGSKLLKYAITTSNSPEAIEATMAQCGVTRDRVLPLGMPRMDKYIDWPTHYWATSYLYAPTFRTLNDKKLDIDLDKMDELLNDDEILFVKHHMIFKGQEIPNKQYKHITFVSKDDPSEKLIAETDVLITDYSSIMFDAHAMGKPVVLFEKDHETYLKNPGMCLPYPDGYSSRHCRTEEELVDLCRSASIEGPQELDEICRLKTVNMCDGHATERVVDLINNILGGKQ